MLIIRKAKLDLPGYRSFTEWLLQPVLLQVGGIGTEWLQRQFPGISQYQNNRTGIEPLALTEAGHGGPVKRLVLSESVPNIGTQHRRIDLVTGFKSTKSQQANCLDHVYEPFVETAVFGGFNGARLYTYIVIQRLGFGVAIYQHCLKLNLWVNGLSWVLFWGVVSSSIMEFHD